MTNQMDGSLKITGRALRIAVNDDPERVIEFDPADTLFAERFYAIYREFDAKRLELVQRSKDLDARSHAVDENGIPSNVEEGIAFLREVCDFMRDKIDYVFGPGTSQKAFGDSRNLEAIIQFFEGMTPYVKQARSKKIEKYTNNRSRKAK